MCGRFNLTATPEEIAEHFQLQRPPRYQPSYNITPAQKILSIVELDVNHHAKLTRESGESTLKSCHAGIV